MPMDKKIRIEQLRRKLAEKKVEALLISQPDNLYYLSGCEGLEGYLLVTPQEAIMVTDFRYIEQAERQSPHCSIFRISGKIAEWLPKLFHNQKVKRIGFESNHLSVASYQQIHGIIRDSGLPIELVSTENLVDSLRTIKDPEEVYLIQKAAKITDDVYDYVNQILRPNLTEKALAWEIEKFMRDHGSQPVPFELIVAAGPNSALPHAKPTERIIQPGEPIVIDIGAKTGYYGSDLTRTVCYGVPDEKFKRVYNTVLDAQQTAIAKIRAGMTGAEADAIARQVIVNAGYGDAFGHSLGHGIGLVTHEKPTVGPNSTEVLSNGMVFTIEPGIYISGWGGVRIEDDVVLENGMPRVISFAKKMKV
jgi:Xaa-Pro aminopeptidase